MTCHKFSRISSFVFGLAAFVLTAATAVAQSFTVTANPQALTVYPGETNVPVTVSVASSTYTGPVNVTLAALPSGITVTPSSLSLTPGSSGTLMLNLALNADQEAFPASGPANANYATSSVSVVGAVGSVTARSPLSLTVTLSNPKFVPSQVNLPIVQINTSGAPVTSTAIDVPGTITITSADGSTTYLPNASDTDDTATFHVHGNTTSEFPKLAYTIDLNTSLDLLSTMGLNCPYVTSKGKEVCDKSKHFVLLANYDDKTLLRDWSASALANAIPFGGSYLDETPVPAPNTGIIPSASGTTANVPWAPHSLFVELYLNGVYEGNYQLIESVKVDSHRVNISELAETDTGASGDDLTGGYLLEIDARKGEDVTFTTPQGLSIGLIDPDFAPDPNVPEQTSYISNYVDAAETAMFSPNFTNPTTGWRAYFDESTLINYYLVNEIMGNVDGGDLYSSVYLYKAIDNPFLYMGPIWDFDISSGNVNYDPIYNPAVPWVQTHAIWYKQLFTDPSFKADVIKQFNALKTNGVFSTWISSISQQASLLQQSQANNFNRWPMLGIKVWPNPEAAQSYGGEVAYLTNFLNLRIGYLDSMFNGKSASTATLAVPSANVYLGAPVTLSAKVTGASIPTGTVTFLSGGVVVGSGTLDSTGAATVTTTNLILGVNSIGLIYNGDSTYALSTSTSKIVTVVEPLAVSVTNLAASASSVVAGGSVTLSVSVEGNTGTATPAGTVAFVTNGKTIGTATLTSGIASYSTASLAAGTNAIQAVYSGSTVYQPSTSAAISVAVVANTVAISLGTSPSGFTYTIDGTPYTSTQNFSYAPGSSHTIAVVSPQTLNGSTSVFSNWSDGGAQSHTIVIPSTPAAYTATFVASGTGVGYGSGFTASGLKLNGSAALNGSQLELTSAGFQAGSAYSTTAVNVQSFTNDFTFRLPSPTADGMTFVIQNEAVTALGLSGSDLGYGDGPSGIQKSVAIKFDLHNNAGEGVDSTGIYINGTAPTVPSTDLTPSGVNLHSGDILHAHMTYNGTTLLVTITDTVTGAVANQSYTINIPSTVGANTAFVGFTAGTGASYAPQNILTWSFTPNAPTVGYGSGFTASGLKLNGSAALNGSQLELTSAGFQAGSAYSTTAVNVQSFTNDFTFRLPSPTADGMTFVIQNEAVTALGLSGSDLGYGDGPSGIQKSVAIKFDLHNNAGEGVDSTGIYINGAAPTVPSTDLTPSGVNLHSGDILHAHMTYNGTTLLVTITDTVTGAVANQSYTINIPSIVGANTAFVGFTAGTGASYAPQNILTWSMTTP